MWENGEGQKQFTPHCAISGAWFLGVICFVVAAVQVEWPTRVGRVIVLTVLAVLLPVTAALLIFAGAAAVRDQDSRTAEAAANPHPEEATPTG